MEVKFLWVVDDSTTQSFLLQPTGGRVIDDPEKFATVSDIRQITCTENIEGSVAYSVEMTTFVAIGMVGSSVRASGHVEADAFLGVP